MNYYDEKPKNDFDKPKNDYARERGGCLTLFLVFIMAANAFGLFYVCSQATQISRYASGYAMPILAVAVGIEAAILACAAAMWNWKKWGYYGLVTAYVIQIVVMLCSGNIASTIGAALGLVILFAVTNSRIEMFE